MYFVNTDGRILIAEVSAKGGTFSSEQPREVSEKSIVYGGAVPPYAVFPDGRRIAVYQQQSAEDSGNVHVTFLLNFFDEVRRRIP